MLAHEAQDSTPVPQRPSRQQPPVGDGLVLVAYDRGGDVPALPAGEHRAVLQVDVLAVEPEARVETAELDEHGAAQQQEAAEHPVGLDGPVGRRLVEMKVVLLLHELPERRPADDRPAHGRKATA